MSDAYATWIPFARHFGKYIYTVSNSVLIAGEADRKFQFIVNKPWREIRKNYPLQPKYFIEPEKEPEADFVISVNGETFFGHCYHRLYVENKADKWRQGRCFILNWLTRHACSYGGPVGLAPVIVEELRKTTEFKIELVSNNVKPQDFPDGLPEYLKGKDIIY